MEYNNYKIEAPNHNYFTAIITNIKNIFSGSAQLYQRHNG